ncbi:LacI family DNA-binding transcriptional regulator [Arthrobacter sp. 35W]|uniref:LacI family DNA-binding transcriptional regulator n=1 Tax=Arthrobacter sp. 35W TaxID=1132441 RepID=UPI001E3757F0|nr:LacI family DNA-binding transcriptional regulator [Arthrobacter sp. 35W]
MTNLEDSNSPDTVAAAPRAGKSAPTIYDIAEMAGVNPSTVSRALSKPGRVSAKTQKLIEDAAATLNYRVNVFARALPTGRTHTVGLIVSDITNPAYFDVIRGAEAAAAGEDYTLMLAESAESAAQELTTAQRMLATVDGIILASPRLADPEILALAKEKPVAVINRQVDGVHSIVADIDAGVGEAVRHLALMGHTSLAYVAGPEKSWMSARRWESLKARCAWSGLDAVQVAAGAPTVEGGRRTAAAVRASGATAVFCYNDLMAIGLMQELQLAGVVVPDKISILGFDNIFGSDFTTPPLSTIRSPLREAGAEALARILADLKGAGSDGAAEPLPTELVLRGSTGRVS